MLTEMINKVLAQKNVDWHFLAEIFLGLNFAPSLTRLVYHHTEKLYSFKGILILWRVAGWLVGVCDIKANSVQLLLQLPTWTELGKIDKIDKMDLI